MGAEGQTYNSCQVILYVDSAVEFVVRLVSAETHSDLHLCVETVDSLRRNSASNWASARAKLLLVRDKWR